MKHIVDIVKSGSTEQSQVQVNGYFYRAESGVFCVLDEHDWHWIQQDERNGQRGLSRKELVN